MAAESRIAVLVGSLRKEAFSRKVANALLAVAPASLEYRIVEIGDLPIYNQDLDEPGAKVPEAWTKFRAEIKASHGVLFVTPEYNRSIPGCLKNAVDVASRPSGQSTLDGLPAGVVSVTPYKLGAFGANHALRQTFVFLNMLVMQQPEAYIANAGELFDDKGRLKSDETRQFLQQFMSAYQAWVAKIAGDRAATASPDFDTFMKRRADIARAYVNGDASPLDQIVARSGAASFFPPTGGVETGAEAVAKRYDADVKTFRPGGESSLEILQSAAGGELAYWTGFQSAKVKMQGQDSPVAMKLRITELFRRVGGEWQLIHRHADGQAEKKPGGS
jgi:NAD(P)H-dependent FMN reductase/ketosteroid isomerase-like protein